MCLHKNDLQLLTRRGECPIFNHRRRHRGRPVRPTNPFLVLKTVTLGGLANLSDREDCKGFSASSKGRYVWMSPSCVGFYALFRIMRTVKKNVKAISQNLRPNDFIGICHEQKKINKRKN